MSSRVEEYHKQIRKKLGNRLKYCGGNVVVLFDELQKAASGTLDGEPSSTTHFRYFETSVCVVWA